MFTVKSQDDIDDAMRFIRQAYECTCGGEIESEKYVGKMYVLGNDLKSGKKFLTNRTASGAEWIPAFVQKVDAEKCTGCGMCIRVCLGNCYELKEIVVNGKKKKVAVVVRPENCLGDCHCHKVCPVQGGAMVCGSKTIR